MSYVDVSVIIPVYNGERYLRFAIDSVLSQTHPPAEIIVVDDGSTDETKTIASTYQKRITYIYKEHSGIGHTVNFGIEHAKSRYVAFLDADDLWVEKKLQLQLEAIRNSKGEMIFGYIEQFISPELNKDLNNRTTPSIDIVPGYSRDTLLIKRDVLLHIGLFSTDYRIGEFVEWYSRAKDLGFTSFMLPIVLTKRRIHRFNTTGGAFANGNDYAKMLKSILDRRRLK